MKKRTKEKEKVEDGKRTTCRRAQSSNHRTRLKSQSSYLYILYLSTVEHRCTSKEIQNLILYLLSLPGTVPGGTPHFLRPSTPQQILLGWCWSVLQTVLQNHRIFWLQSCWARQPHDPSHRHSHRFPWVQPQVCPI